MPKPRALPPPRQSALTSGTGATSLLSEDERLANDTAIDTFAKIVGGRDALTEVLSVAADQPECDHVVSLLLDPRYDGMTLRRLCRLANLTIVDLFAAYKSAMVAKAHLVAYHTITEKLLPVVDDVMTRAAPYQVGCDACGSDGKARDERGNVLDAPCHQCAGSGRVYQLPDLDRQKLALELAQLVQKSAGINMNLTQQTLNLGGGGGGRSVGDASALIQMQQAVRAMLSGPRTPIPDDDGPPESSAPADHAAPDPQSVVDAEVVPDGA